MLIDGRRVTIQHAADYAQWRVAAERLAEESAVPGEGAANDRGRADTNFLGIRRADPQPIEGLDSAFREQAVKNCMDVLRECGGQADREDALKLLGQLGALQ